MSARLFKIDRRSFIIKKKHVLDLFIIANFGFLSVDILYAHSVNHFAHPAEYLPLVFSAAATGALALGLFLPGRLKEFLSSSIGAASVVTGALGLYFHLESQFFKEQTLASLTYTAPLVAPLTYTALGLLLFLNRFVSSETRAWGAWVYLIAYFGFAGNFVLSVCDHYQNQFYYPSEWIPVVASALLLGVGPFYLLESCRPSVRSAVIALVAAQAAVGVLGFGLHLRAVLAPGGRTGLIERLLYGPPLLAPLLFVNLAVLLAIGMKAMGQDEKLLELRSR